MRARRVRIQPLRSLVVLPFVAAALLVASLVLGAGERQLSSAWRTDSLRIDGNDEEWRGLTVPFEKQRFALGLQNDGEALYLCLTTRDRVLSTQIARQGLMLWLDPGPERPKKHVFGVHFPIDPHLAAARESGRWPREGAQIDEWTQAAVGILGPSKDEPMRVALSDTGGIQACARFRGEVLIYEMRVPLKGGGAARYEIAARPGDTIRLEIQTPEWRGPLPPSPGPVGFSAASSAPGGRGVIGYPAVDATYLKQTDVKAAVRLSAAQ